jgi:oxygen-independent coproporphyrinogen-3 oxidase
MEARHDLSQPASTAELLARYDRPGPRYTSYPTALSFHEGVGEEAYLEHLARADEAENEPLSLYAHLPFCRERCLYCGCNVVVTPHHRIARDYLGNLLEEIDLLARHLPRRRTLSQLHWGGGTPTYYTAFELSRLMAAITERFAFTRDAEIGIEVDPRSTDPAHLETLGGLGFNRLSAGIQDFAPEVQEAIHRVQSFEQTRDVLVRARAAGFRSINVDLIYGLPLQTVAGFRRTLEQVLELKPDRIAVYSFAFVPWIKGHMRNLAEDALPGPELKLELLANALDTFTAAGYCAIGMDHFALPNDELALAAAGGTLGRNFMGYTVQSARDLVGVGISAIGDVQGGLFQNDKKLVSYERAAAEGRFPIERGYVLDADDRLRRDVITDLMCNARLDYARIERAHGIRFADRFKLELAELAAPDGPVADGLVVLRPGGLELTDVGRLFVRNVAMVFDRHLRESRADGAKSFSRTV